MAAIGVAVVSLLYSLQYFLGQLPEEGPVRFGLPMIVLVCSVAAAARPRIATPARVLALVALGVSAVWALEGFAYTLATYLAIAVAQSWLQEPGGRLRRLGGQVGLAAVACVVAHGVFALATLIGSGHLPDWGQYAAYVGEFLLGGTAGSITYGSSDWCAGLAADAAARLSTAANVL